MPSHPRSTLFPYTTLFRSTAAPQSTRWQSSPPHHRQSRRTNPHRRTQSERRPERSEEHTSELQSRFDLVCRLLLEKKILCKITNTTATAEATSNKANILSC